MTTTLINLILLTADRNCCVGLSENRLRTTFQVYISEWTDEARESIRILT